jgi:hypothetical protein
MRGDGLRTALFPALAMLLLSTTCIGHFHGARSRATWTSSAVQRKPQTASHSTYQISGNPGVFAFAQIDASIIPFDDDAFVALKASASLP